VWQIACGNKGRRYDDLFIAHDIMLIGPGRLGEYNKPKYEAAVADGVIKKSRADMIKAFAADAQPGDVILARSGYRVVAIGYLVEYYEHNQNFDDIDGWDLEHTRRVLWQDHLTGQLSELQAESDLFADRKQIPTFTRVGTRSMLDRVEPMANAFRGRPLRELPPRVPWAMSPEAIKNALFREGLGFDAVQQVERTINKLAGLLEFYRHNGQRDRPSEHEIVAHVTVPILLALGWSEQLLAVEWHKVDLAVFSGTPTTKDNCVLLCEAKGANSPTGRVVEQAARYWQQLALNNCRKLLVAAGGRLYLYRRAGEGWESSPSGYVNLLKIRRRHLLPANTDAIETLMALTPSHVSR
jgi:hypothetical protein